jgi:hypothetical protein
MGLNASAIWRQLTSSLSIINANAASLAGKSE